MNGLRSAGRFLLTNDGDKFGKSYQEIPNHCYDVGNGYLDPERKAIFDYQKLTNCTICIVSLALLLPSWSRYNALASEVESLRFKSQAGQIGHRFAGSSPPLQ